MPWRAASRMVSRRLHATHKGGWGFCLGLGITMRGGIEVQRPPERPLEGPPERRRRRLAGADVVAIAAGQGAAACVEAGLHGVDTLHPAVAREQGVEGPPQAVRRPALRGGEADAQAEGVHPGIGAPRGVRRGAPSEQALEHALELGLDRAAVGLALPPDESGTVELERGEVGPAHRPGI